MRAQLCPTLCSPMDAAHQAFLSLEFSRQEYWSGLPFPTPGGLPNLGMTLRFCSNQGEDWRRHLLHWVTDVDWMVQDSDGHI